MGLIGIRIFEGIRMKFTKTGLSGLIVIDVERVEDERGFFGRCWCVEEFKREGLSTQMSQCSISFNLQSGTLRGLHYQDQPHSETKLLRCTRGAIFDVLLDLRPQSPTFKNWESFELSEDNCRMLYVPAGLAHGFITVKPNSEVFYQIDKPYVPEAARGVRWNDPEFSIAWPFEPKSISTRDSSYPDFTT